MPIIFIPSPSVYVFGGGSSSSSQRQKLSNMLKWFVRLNGLDRNLTKLTTISGIKWVVKSFKKQTLNQTHLWQQIWIFQPDWILCFEDDICLSHSLSCFCFTSDSSSTNVMCVCVSMPWFAHPLCFIWTVACCIHTRDWPRFRAGGAGKILSARKMLPFVFPLGRPWMCSQSQCMCERSFSLWKRSAEPAKCWMTLSWSGWGGHGRGSLGQNSHFSVADE